MTRLAAYNPADGQLGRFVRQLRRILTPAEGGLSWADNVGPVVTYTARGDASDVTVPLGDRPRSVWLLRAVDGADVCQAARCRGAGRTGR
jgi:hypothetical protein